MQKRRATLADGKERAAYQKCDFMKLHTEACCDVHVSEAVKSGDGVIRFRLSASAYVYVHMASAGSNYIMKEIVIQVKCFAVLQGDYCTKDARLRHSLTTPAII